MNLHDVYSTNFLGEAVLRLQAPRAGDEDCPRQLMTDIKGPEVLSDSFLREVLALHYVFALGFDFSGKPIMGELGGVIARHPEHSGSILAIAEASLSKVLYGIEWTSESRRTQNPALISTLEERIERPLKDKQGITVVDGNRNVAHYDFTTCVAAREVTDLLVSCFYLMLTAEGFTVVTHKHLPHEHYVFNIPVPDRVLHGIREMNSTDPHTRSAFLKTLGDELLPEGFVAGFHFSYSRTLLSIRPLIAERDSSHSKTYGVSPTQSPLAFLGTSDPYGRPLGTLKPFL